MELVAHIVIIALAAFVVYSAQPGSSLFSWHPTCMILAALLWTEGIISFRRPPPSLRVNIHWALNATAITLAISGFLSIYRNKEENEKPHFTTWHGIAGLVTMGLLLIQTIGGNTANFSVPLSKFVPAIRPALIKWGHRVSGALSLTSIYVTLLLAIGSLWFTAIVSSIQLWWGIAIGIVYTYLYTLVNANFSRGGGKPKDSKAKN